MNTNYAVWVGTRLRTMSRLGSFNILKHMLQIVDHNAKTTDLALTSLINQHYISALLDEVDRAKYRGVTKQIHNANRITFTRGGSKSI